MINMNKESPFTAEQSPKDVYFQTIKYKVDALLSQGRLTEAYVAGVLERAGYVEGPFEDDAAARDSAEQFLSTVETVAAFIDKLNMAEMQCVAFAGEVELMKNEVSQKEGLAEGKKRQELEKLDQLSADIDTFVQRLQLARSNFD